MEDYAPLFIDLYGGGKEEKGSSLAIYPGGKGREKKVEGKVTPKKGVFVPSDQRKREASWNSASVRWRRGRGH